jgi:NosR/NirI family transcriptional regulator, nitrous oxide reductase regulator
MKTFIFGLVLVLIAVCVDLSFMAPVCAAPDDLYSIELDSVRELFPAAFSAEGDPAVPSQFHIKDSEENLIGSVLSTESVSDDIIGHAGPIPLLIGLDTDGVIVGISLRENRETPGYLLRLGGREFFENWTGLTVAEARHKKVDAVTGATRTSRAIIESVQRRLSLVE